MNVRALPPDPRIAAALDAGAAPLDAVRRRALAAVTRSRTVARVVGRRDVRVPLVATTQIATLLAVTVARPLWLFVLGPIVLGVPHLLSDVRYLVARRRVARDVVAAGCAASIALIALRALDAAHAPLRGGARLEMIVATAWIAVAVVAGARERRSLWPLLALPAVVAAGTVASTHAALARVVVAQAHNVVGVVAWAVVFRRKRRAALIPIAALAAGALLLASGALLPWTLRAGGLAGMGVDLERVGAYLVPGGSPQVAAGAALVFVFLQAAHYAAWLVWIPQEELPGQGTFTFRMSARSLVADVGIAGVAVAAALSLALAGAAWADTGAAVRAYMSLAAFHAYFELAMLAYFAARGRRREP